MTRADLLSIPMLLIASVAVVTLLGWVAAPVKSWMILNPYRVRTKSEVHRLLTAGWLHGDVSHFVFNMLALYFFAPKPLAVMGPFVFIAFYVSAVVVAFLPTTLRFMGDRRYNSLGASGGISAVMFSAILLDPTQKLHLMFLPILAPAWVFAILYVAHGLWSRGSRDNVNHDAHLSGAAYGAVFTFLFAHEQVRSALHRL